MIRSALGGDLGSDEDLADGGGAVTLAGDLPGGGEAEQDSGEKPGGDRECDDAPVRRDGEPGGTGGESHESAEQEIAYEQTGGGAQQGEREAFGE